MSFYSMHKYIFYLFSAINTLIFISVLVGDHYLPDHLPYFKAFFQTYISIFLLIKYNPLTRPSLTQLDTDMIYTVAFYLLFLNLPDLYKAYQHFLVKANTIIPFKVIS